ncbi:MAG: HK97 family phage prohead protease [Anaerolineales bacterium]|jgi:HK97 family phage prohead protease
MSAIPVHHTKTVDEKWDGGANTKALLADKTEAYYRKMYAWQDPEGDATKKSTYKFPHHMVDSSGTIGAANVKACQSIIAILNGGMGGADIPDKDRQGVYNHASAHLKDAGEEPAELKSADPNVERRSVSVELRAALVENKPVIEGVAAVYNQEAVIGGWQSFRETILPGAFTEVLSQNPDVIAANNHDWTQVLGRTTNGTLRLTDGPDGLHYSIDINPDDQEAMNLYAKVKRGDIKQSSFSFNVKEDRWLQPEDKNILPLRTVVTYSELIDVSPVTFPAYDQTSAAVRSKLNELSATSEVIPEPGGEGHATPEEEAARAQVRAHMAARRRMLDLADLF